MTNRLAHDLDKLSEITNSSKSLLALVVVREYIELNQYQIDEIKMVIKEIKEAYD